MDRVEHDAPRFCDRGMQWCNAKAKADKVCACDKWAERAKELEQERK
jgi:hypothetical protein